LSSTFIMSTNSVGDAATALSRRARRRECGQSILDWPRRRRRSCHRPYQLGGREREVLNGPALAAGAFRRGHVLPQLEEDRGRYRGRHCLRVAGKLSIGRALTLPAMEIESKSGVLTVLQMMPYCLELGVDPLEQLMSSTYRGPSSDKLHTRDKTGPAGDLSSRRTGRCHCHED
jgi:hypothetical protein